MQEIGLILEVAVVLGRAFRPQDKGYYPARVTEIIAPSEMHGNVVVAVIIRLVDTEGTGNRPSRIDPAGIKPGNRRAVVEILIFATDAAGYLEGVKRAAAGIQAETRRLTRTLAGEYMNHTAQGLRSPQAGTRAAHDLDALYQGRRQMLKSGSPQGCRPDPDPVDQHQDMVAFGPAHANPRCFAVTAADRYIDTGNPPQQFRQ